MKRISALFFLFFALRLSAQTDSAGRNPVNQSARVSVANQQKDSSVSNAQMQTQQAVRENDAFSSIYKNEMQKGELSFYIADWFCNRGIKQSVDLVTLHTESNTGGVFFYCLLVIVSVVGLVNLLFPQYLYRIFQFVFQPRIRKKNFKSSNNSENVIPSLLLNFLFVVTSGLYVAQVTKNNFSIDADWKLWLYAAVIITLIYLIKFIGIKILGWIFNASNIASIYDYVVFTINKIWGVMLIPLIILTTYGSADFASFIYSASGVVVVLLLAYRYVASFVLIRGKAHISVFHFFMYLCAIEILPLLILYKVLITKFGSIA